MEILERCGLALMILLLSGGFLMIIVSIVMASQTQINKLKEQHKEEKYKKDMRAWNKMYRFGILCVAGGIVCLILLIIYH